MPSISKADFDGTSGVCVTKIEGFSKGKFFVLYLEVEQWSFPTGNFTAQLTALRA
jgi:hypothetical protein